MKRWPHDVQNGSREPKVTTGYLKRYSALVTSGNRGAVLEVPEEK